MTEVWKPVPGYEGRYEASSEGRVRSAGLVVGARNGKTAFRPGRLLKQATKTNRYLQVTLVAANGRRCSWMVHRLVCLTFHGPCPPGQEVRHLDGSRDGNRVDNMVYGTKADNAADRAAHGRFVSNLPHLVERRAE